MDNTNEQARNNHCAAGCAYEILQAYAPKTSRTLLTDHRTATEADRTEIGATLTDLLADLRHFCRAAGLDYHAHDNRAEEYFAEELEASGEEPALDYDRDSDDDGHAPQEPLCEVCGWQLSDAGNETLPDGRLACTPCARGYYQRRDVERAIVLSRPRGGPVLEATL